MDQLLLHAVVSEAAARLVEQEVLRVSHLGAWRYLLRFAPRKHDNLLISVRPDLPRFHLVRAGARVPEQPPDRFAALLDREIGGAVLTALVKRPWDRVVEMAFRLPRREDRASERRLVAELLGRSSNLLLLDEAGTTPARCRDRASEFRASADGGPYTPPPGREAFADLPAAPAALPLIRRRFADPAAFLDSLSPLLGRDLRAVSRSPASGAAGDALPSWSDAAEHRLRQILEAMQSGRWAPIVYSHKPLAEMTAGESVRGDDLVVSALPLLGSAGPGSPGVTMVSARFDSPSEAAEASLGLLERLRDFQALKDRQAGIVRREIRRLTTLIARLREEAEAAGRADLHRRQGEALLAGLRAATVQGSMARVPDPYAPEAQALDIPVDPTLSLEENAQALFERYKKAKRGLRTITTRLAAAESRLREWEALVDVAAGARDIPDLERLREMMGRLGIMQAPARPRPAAPSARGEATARVRRHTSPDGLLILVGRNGEENEALTFRIASPWDFWLHAALTHGAHVVVRNPKRLKTIPEATLIRAAEIAAFYSGARGEGKVAGHYTQGKNVAKRKGAPSGEVLVRRFRSIQVTPRIPAATAQDV